MDNFLGRQPTNDFYDTSGEKAKLEADMKELYVTTGSLGLSILGLVTGFGEAADAMNAALFYSTGHPILGTLSAASAIPIPGWEHILGVSVGACLLVKCLFIEAKIIKSSILIVSRQKVLRPVYIFFQNKGKFFTSMLEQGKVIISQLKSKLSKTPTHTSNLKIDSDKLGKFLEITRHRPEPVKNIASTKLNSRKNLIGPNDSASGLMGIGTQAFLDEVRRFFQRIGSFAMKKFKDILASQERLNTLQQTGRAYTNTAARNTRDVNSIFDAGSTTRKVHTFTGKSESYAMRNMRLYGIGPTSLRPFK